jgi:ketosteroid isomerase-like protein
MADAAALVRTYLSLLETCDTNPAAYAEVLHPEAPQAGHPELLTRPGRQGARLAAQAFNLEHLHTCANDTVVVEARWWGEVGADSPAFSRGQHLTGHFCMIFELHDGKIFRQRSYDYA